MCVRGQDALFPGRIIRGLRDGVLTDEGWIDQCRLVGLEAAPLVGER
jgi:hypothetical protein